MFQECSSNPCHPTQSLPCVDQENAYFCPCVAGYTGVNCQTNINECSSQPCVNGGTCVDGVDRYDCVCLPGYSGVNCQTDVNECSSLPCANGGTCTDQVNGYVCGCVPGFVGLNCQTNTDECGSGPCVNSATCIDGINRYDCVCLSGYSGVNCQTDINECSSAPCANGGTCIDSVNRFDCVCPAGYQGINCQTDIDECASSPCWAGRGTCVDLVDAFQCNCLPGYSGERCQTDINECASQPCDNGGTCVDGVARYDCVCVVGFSGVNCQTDINECSSDPCANGGTCIDRVNRFDCICPAGYQGVNCQTDINECASSPCWAGRGTCVDLVDAFQCNCLPGFSGERCQTDINECASQPCVGGNSVSCTDQVNGFLCTCRAGFSGQRCQTDIDECASAPCANGGTCIDNVNSFTCTCAAGFTGIRCETDVNECASQPCSNGATCIDGVNRFDCVCAAGFSGISCQTDINECASFPCANGGTCTDLVNRYTCSCVPGYSGLNCQTDVNECGSSPCANGGVCTDLVNGYTCTCRPGFTGVRCQTNINECASNPCRFGAACVDGIDSFTCVCVPGYTGTLCQTDINECGSNPCVNGACVDRVNGYQCQCQPCWSGPRCDQSVTCYFNSFVAPTFVLSLAPVTERTNNAMLVGGDSSAYLYFDLRSTGVTTAQLAGLTRASLELRYDPTQPIAPGTSGQVQGVSLVSTSFSSSSVLFATRPSALAYPYLGSFAAPPPRVSLAEAFTSQGPSTVTLDVTNLVVPAVVGSGGTVLTSVVALRVSDLTSSLFGTAANPGLIQFNAATLQISATPISTPSLVEARFSDLNAAVVFLTFSNPMSGYTSVGATIPCNTLLSAASLAQIGGASGVVCRYAAPQAMQLTIANPILIPAPGVLWLSFQTTFDVASPSVLRSVLAPLLAQAPTFTLLGPLQIGLCTDLQINIANLANFYGRASNATWTVNGVVVLSDVATNPLLIPAAQLQAGVTTNISVVVTNFYNLRSAPVQQQVFVSTVFLPTLTLTAPAIVFRSRAFFLEALVSYPACVPLSLQASSLGRLLACFCFLSSLLPCFASQCVKDDHTWMISLSQTQSLVGLIHRHSARIRCSLLLLFD